METNGIVPLSKFEIEMVSGGKSVVGNFWETLGRWFDGMSGPPDHFSLSIHNREIPEFTRFIADNGGSIAQSGSLAAGTLNIRLTGSDGSYTFILVS